MVKFNSFYMKVLLFAIFSFTVLAANNTVIQIKKTEQTISYDENGSVVNDDSLKDDGFYQTGVNSNYSRSNDVVTDNITGLIWQDNAEAATVLKQWVTQANYDAENYDDTSGDTAATYCSDLTLGNYNDWRLPTVTELQGIVADGKFNPAMDNTVFANIANSHSPAYWSSTTDAGKSEQAWRVDFYYGSANYAFPKYKEDEPRNIRCVRDGQSYVITPKEFLFGTAVGEKVFTVTNPYIPDVILPAAILEGPQAASFTITDNCSGKTLAQNENCTITVRYPASTDSSLSAYLNIANVTAFLHNYESTAEEAERRLPPVIDDLNISEVMHTGTDYNLTWSIVGYGDDYTAYVAFFDCNDTAEGSCGENYGSAQRFDQGLSLTPYLTENTDWTYLGVDAKRYHYNYHFTAQADKFGNGDTPIVIRFYYVDGKDLAVGQGAISLMIPGNLSENYYDTSGRKIQKIIRKP